MKKILDNTILNEITRHYLESHDFNGIPVATLCKNLDIELSGLLKILIHLMKKKLVGPIFSDVEVNTHIIRTGFEPIETQMAKLPNSNIHHTCLYPLPAHLQKIVDVNKYAGKPYTLALALGSPQIAFRSFELSILEHYRSDPRYHYENDDVRGSISFYSDKKGNSSLADKDQVFLQSFGFSYDEKFNRAVAVFVRYLSGLTSEHQQIWKAKELSGNFKLHPDYYRNSIIGEWGKGASIFDAFIEEIYIINQMSKAMGRPQLFLTDYGEYGERKPKKFSFLVRPTLEEFNSFVLLLDQMISENINKKFFKKEIPYATEIERKDGKIIVQNKGSLQILDQWMRKFYRTTDWKPWDIAMSAFKKVRKLRQKPAHQIDENVFDQKYYKNQRQLIIKTYEGVHILRLMFQNHPYMQKAKITIPEWLTEGTIWTQ